MKILIIGHKRHGKDTLAEMIKKHTGFTFSSSSEAALDIFLYDVLNTKYNANYVTKEEAFKDRVNCRDIWFNEISEYNREDPTRLAREILKKNDIYVGMRNQNELEHCIAYELFDLVIGIYDYRKEMESKDSLTIDIFEWSDLIITNNGTLYTLENKVKNILVPYLVEKSV